jgi:hypothetical protein
MTPTRELALELLKRLREKGVEAEVVLESLCG